MLPSVEQIEEYAHTVEVYVLSSVAAVTPDLPQVRETVSRLWADVARHAPSGLTEIRNHIPGLGTFELPPPPPPPPPPSARQWAERWVSEHRKLTLAIGAGVVGTSVVVGYATVQARRQARLMRARSAGSSERRQVVVLLGADHPLALPLMRDLEKSGYIVVASAESPETCQELENKCHGYVRVLPLDPADPETVPVFLRSLASTLSRRFPINVAGDPHVSPTQQPYIHSVVSLLPLPGSSQSAAPPSAAPLEHIALDMDYEPYLHATHLAPLQLVQALLPLLRTSPARARDRGARSVVVCVPAPGPGPFTGVRAMSAAATRAALDVLRKEVAASAGAPVRVVTVDVGAVATAPTDAPGTVDAWTPSERAAYGASFAALLEEGLKPRRVTGADAFAHTLVGVVSGGRPHTPTALGLALWRVRGWLRRDTLIVGAGVRTYGLPPALLDALLNLPAVLIGIRNALLPILPFIRTPPARARTRSPPAATRPVQVRRMIEAAESESSGASAPASDVEADAESNGEQDSGPEHGSNGTASGVPSMASSWVDVDEA